MIKNRKFFYLFLSQTISSFGDFFGLLAIEWLVYEMTGSLLLMGSILTAMGVTQLVVGFLGGPLIDRVNRYHLMYCLDILSFIAIGMPALLGFLGYLEIWHLFIAIILLGASSALLKPTGMAVLPEIINDKDELVRANSMLSIGTSSAVVIGPGLAGATIKYFGASQSLAIDAISFLFSAFLISLLARKVRKEPNDKPRQQNVAKVNGSTTKKYFSELIDGLKFFLIAPYLLVIMIMVSLRNMSALAVAAITLPYGLEILHVDALGVGLLSSSSTIGILVGSSLLIYIGDVKNRRIPMLGSVCLGGILYLSLAFISSFWLAIIVFFFLGMTGPFFGSFSSTIYAQVVPNQYLGRVMSARLLVGGSLQPVGSYLGGALSHLYGIPFLLFFIGFIPALAGFVGYFLPVTKKIDGELKEIEIDKVDAQKGIGI
ncbi:MFS family permease [Salirhabdus euzebyi]|uniref:MFS family permease n=1 Tax=Salirhabdus euzebyi TaxID=394506 RepID=A0A841Q761_9BACI|nr:MFS transporter [Salirhabdus euzebyi]MBB6454251.1 MFS family permease [Salirhabdus euzebyi]